MLCICRIRVLDQILPRKGAGQELKRYHINTCSYLKWILLKIPLLASSFCAVPHRLCGITNVMNIHRTHKALGFPNMLSRLEVVSKSNTASVYFACSDINNMFDSLQLEKVWVSCLGSLHI